MQGIYHHKSIRNGLSFLLWIGLAMTSRAQLGNALDRADKAFERMAYVDAIRSYKTAYQKDPSNVLIGLQIAESFRRLNLPDSSVRWFRLLENNDRDVEPIHAYHYAEALLSTGQDEQAIKWYEEYRKEASSDSRTARKLEGLKNQKDFYDTEHRYEVSLMPFNSEALEFSPTYYGDGLVFVSSRKREASVMKEVYSWDHSEFLDLYYWSEGNLPERSVQRFHKEINSRYHEGPLDFYRGDSMMVFTRNDFFKGKVGRSSKKVTKLQLYFAVKTADGSWTNVRQFPFNNAEYSTGHPAIAEDGSKLIFVSDRPGGKGGTDLYLSEFKKNKWQRPINLEDLNTEGNEMFPYWVGEHLFFASNGHEGLGGLDVYRVRLDPALGPTALNNLGSPINSSKDDFGLIITEDFMSGYFTSNRGENKDDIYAFSHFPSTHLVVKGDVRYAADDSRLPFSMVVVEGEGGETIANQETDSLGEFTASIPRDKEVKLRAKKQGWNLVKEVGVNTIGNRDTIANVTIYMQREELFGLVAGTDKVTGDFLEDVSVEISKLGDSTWIRSTKAVEEYKKFTLDPGNSYIVHVTKEGYFTGTDTLTVDNDAIGTVQLAIPMEKIVIGKAIKLENIYYDVNKSNIRDDAARELNKLVTMLEENPAIRIELSSHTDARGSDVYNLTLSQKRATSAVNYIISQGIESPRIIARGYGESQPVNRCRNGVSCTSDEHQQNRRTEFKVIALLPSEEVN